MVINNYLVKYLGYIILFFSLSSFQCFAHKPKLNSGTFLNNWKLEIKTGIGALLTPVPDKYLERINNVNIPLRIPGPIGIFSIKKCFAKHLEMGYQLDYMRIQGNVDKNGTDTEVLTQAYTHTYLIQYNLKRTNDFKPLLNYFLYYKIGGISLKNDPIDKTAVTTPDESTGKFIANVAVLTGIGAGINYQLNNNFSLLGSLDINRSSDAVDDIYKIHKLFYRSPHAVNNYISLTFGLSYLLDFTKKKSTYFKPRSEAYKPLMKAKRESKKGKSKVVNHSIWYDSKKGK